MDRLNLWFTPSTRIRYVSSNIQSFFLCRSSLVVTRRVLKLESREKRNGAISEFHVHPCRASLRFRRLCAALTRLMHESSAARRLFLSRHPLSCACLCPFLHATLFVSFALSPFLAFPSDILALTSLRVLRLCQGAVSLLPFPPLLFARLCLACRLRHHQRPAITFLKRLKRSGCFARKSHSTFGQVFSPRSTNCIIITRKNSRARKNRAIIIYNYSFIIYNFLLSLVSCISSLEFPNRWLTWFRNATEQSIA